MGFPEDNLLEEITYWALAGRDAFGAITYDTPIIIKARWEQTEVLFIDTQGQERRSEAIVYVDRDVVNLGKLFRGKSTVTNPDTIDAREIRSFKNIPLIDNSSAERRAFL